MNTSKSLFIALFISAILFACSDENTNDPLLDATVETPVELSEIEAIIAAASESDGGMSNLRKGRKTVVLPEGSTDELQDAIMSAGEGGIVILKSGMHRESGTVNMPFGVRIVGESGAILEVTTSSSSVLPNLINPALHILNADRTLIWGLQIQPTNSDMGGTAILVENSKHVVIAKNNIVGHQFSILIEQGDHARLWKNEIVATSQGLSSKHGIVVINGDYVHIVNNDISNGVFGVWACDTKGKYMHNTTQGNAFGLILCKVPANNYELPGGNLVGAEFSANRWFVARNQSINNALVGYIVIDGANNNTIINNKASGNGTYDIELVGDSFRFGFLTPFSFDNKVVAGKFQTISIKDCGVDNTVIGGQQIDISADACY